MQDYEREHLERLRPCLAECAVLLKSNGDFPLEAPGKLALYGSGARRTIKGGTGSGEVNSRSFITVEDGLRRAGFTITTDEWLDAYDAVVKTAKERFFRELRNEARQKSGLNILAGLGAVMPEPEYYLPLNGEGDTAVYVLGRISGEGSDRNVIGGDILLSGPEIRDILALRRKYKKFLLILNVGGPVDLSPIPEVENILVLSQLGVETGAAAADILLGKANPSGKLTTTWADWEDYSSLGEFGDRDDTRYREGVYVGYRCFDSIGRVPRFPFGYGLSYTSFSLASPAVALEGETVTVSSTVTNTGSRPGKEVLQVYVSVPAGTLDQPYQTLAAFVKTPELAPGAAETVSAAFRLSELASYDAASSAYVLEKGDYIVRAGTSSRDTVPCGILRLEETVPVLQARHVFGAPGFTDWKPETPAPLGELPPELPVLAVAPAALPRETVNYSAEYEIDEAVKALSDQELAYLNIGAFDPKGGPMSIIGTASTNVAGAAGETTGALKDKGFPVLIMADGPAGLRLSGDYFTDEKGAHSLGGAMPESLLELLPAPAKTAMRLMAKKPKKGTEMRHQYCTAIPIGTAIAQSWNLALAEECGDIVGEEMVRFGIHLWLAPALNIHRSIRCGRNFEYFSEDPLVSGKMAAAITRGVQKHPGRSVTVKHYAANNQETNRYNNNSRVSERAMREIYLRGFGICVREAQPHAVMTSYNLLNGVHTSESRELIEFVLRREFGFQGIVMTDWVVSGGTMDKSSIYPAPHASQVAAAGGDLFMPGGKGDYKNLLNALASGVLTREQLEINATRVYRMALKLTKL